MQRALTALVVAVLAFAGAACGGSEEQLAASSVGEVAGLVPASTPALIAFETDPDSEQWQRADALLDRFPGKQRLLDELRKGLAEEGLNLEEDLLPAAGDETYLAFLDFEDDGENVVVLTQPRDPEKLEQVLADADEPTVTRVFEGWTLIAETDAVLDRFTQAGDKLEDAEWFAAAQESVEEAGLVTFFLNGVALQEGARASLPENCELPEGWSFDYFAGVLTAEENGVRARLNMKGPAVDGLTSGTALLDYVPARVFGYFGAPGFDLERFGFADQLRCGLGEDTAEAEKMLGTSIEEILDLFTGGFAFYVRSGPLLPEFTLLLEPEDADKAVSTLDALAERAGPLLGGQPKATDIDGIAAKELKAGPVTVSYGAHEGRVVVTTSRAGFDALRGEGDSLADDDRFKEATDAAGVEDGDDVYAYLDLGSLVELLGTISGFADESIPPEVEANLEPLRSFVAWGNVGDSDEAEYGLFLEIR